MFFAAYTIRVMRLAEHVACFGETTDSTKFMSGKLKGRNHFEGVSVTRTILKRFLKKYDVEWIHLGHDQLRALTNVINNIKRLGIYRQAERLLVSQEPCTTELTYTFPVVR
jgi:hypothetical protein